MRKPTLQFIGLLTAVMMLPALVWAAQMTGKVQSISRKANTIQMMNLKTNEVEVIRFSKNTKVCQREIDQGIHCQRQDCRRRISWRTGTADQACPGQGRS